MVIATMNSHFYRPALVTLLLLIATMLVGGTAAYAQVSVRAEVSPQSGDTEDIFTFAVVIEGARSAAAPSLSGGSDFQVRYVGPNSFVSIVNGSITARTSHVFQMTPKREGELLTPAARVTIDGRDYEVAPMSVQVEKGKPSSNLNGKPGDADVIFRQSATSSTAYEGQQVVNIVDLYTAVSLTDLEPMDPTTDGFWQEPISEGDRAQRNVNGRPYETLQFVRALYPLASGTLVIPPRRLRAKALRPPRNRGSSSFDPFDPFSNDLVDQLFQRPEYEQISLRTNQVSLTVKPLPPAPAELQPLLGPSTLVGDTSVTVDSDVSLGRVGESKTITYHVVSEGNLNPLTELSMAAPDGLKVYPERPETKRERRGGKLLLRRSFPFSVVPLKPGLIKIPPVQLAFFNPEKGQYELAVSKEVSFAAQGESLVDERGKPRGSASAPNSPLPTLPPLPFGPDLEYNEATLLESITSAISLKTALLIASVLFGLWLLITLAARLRGAAPVEGLTRDDLERVETLPQLEDFLRRLAASRIPMLREESSLDEIRARVSSQTKDPDLALAVCSVFDELELLRYGTPGQAEDREGTGGLKARVRPLLKAWQAGN